MEHGLVLIRRNGSRLQHRTLIVGAISENFKTTIFLGNSAQPKLGKLIYTMNSKELKPDSKNLGCFPTVSQNKRLHLTTYTSGSQDQPH